MSSNALLEREIEALSHHAYLLEGDPERLARDIESLLEKKHGIAAKGNPDFSRTIYPAFGIDESRALAETAIKKANLQGGKKIYIIAALSITREAENALLKTLEEPIENSHFFFIVPDASRLASTLRSRFMMLGGTSRISEERLKEAELFLASDIGKRLEMVKSITEADDEGATKRDEAAHFIDAVIGILHKQTVPEKKEKWPTEAFRELSMTRSYLGDRSSSVKMLLEHCAVVVPRVTV
jgi:hypothetical protein